MQSREHSQCDLSLSWWLVYLILAVSFSYLSCLSSTYIYMILCLLYLYRATPCRQDITSAISVEY